MKQIQRMQPGSVRPPLIACDYRTSAGQRKSEKRGRMKISFPSEKQTIKTFVANLRRCEGLHFKRPESHFKDVCDEVVETLSKSKIKGFDVFMSSVPKKMGQMASLPSPSREPSIPRNVGTKRKRIIDSDDGGDDIVEITPSRELAGKPKTQKAKRSCEIDIDVEDGDIATESVALSQQFPENFCTICHCFQVLVEWKAPLITD